LRIEGDVDEEKFHPRLTVVEDLPRTIMVENRALVGQDDISELSLPSELVNQPIGLTHFITGYISYEQIKSCVNFFSKF